MIMMYVITGDRLVCIINALKYQSRVTKRRLRIAITLTCCFSITMEVLSDRLSSLVNINIFILIAVGFVYVVLAITTYSLVFWQVKKSNQQFNIMPRRNVESIKKRFLVPRIIIFTFLLLYIFPFTLYYGT